MEFYKNRDELAGQLREMRKSFSGREVAKNVLEKCKSEISYINDKAKKIADFENLEKEKEVDYIITAKGSRYRFLEDGKTQRYKKVEGKEYEIQDVIVFLPDYDTLKKSYLAQITEEKFEKTFGENWLQYEQIILESIHRKKEGQKVYVINEKGLKMSSNKQIKAESGNVVLASITGDAYDYIIPVSKTPRVGFQTYDTRKYYDEERGERLREQHIGNKITEIVYK